MTFVTCKTKMCYFRAKCLKLSTEIVKDQSSYTTLYCEIADVISAISHSCTKRDYLIDSIRRKRLLLDRVRQANAELNCSTELMETKVAAKRLQLERIYDDQYPICDREASSSENLDILRSVLLSQLFEYVLPLSTSVLSDVEVSKKEKVREMRIAAQTRVPDECHNTATSTDSRNYWSHIKIWDEDYLEPVDWDLLTAYFAYSASPEYAALTGNLPVDLEPSKSKLEIQNEAKLLCAVLEQSSLICSVVLRILDRIPPFHISLDDFSKIMFSSDVSSADKIVAFQRLYAKYQVNVQYIFSRSDNLVASSLHFPVSTIFQWSTIISQIRFSNKCARPLVKLLIELTENPSADKQYEDCEPRRYVNVTNKLPVSFESLEDDWESIDFSQLS